MCASDCLCLPLVVAIFAGRPRKVAHIESHSRSELEELVKSFVVCARPEEDENEEEEDGEEDGEETLAAASQIAVMHHCNIRGY